MNFLIINFQKIKIRNLLFFLFFGFYLLFLAANPIFAAEGYKLEVPLPPMQGIDPGAGIAQYIQYLYVFAIALAGFLALGMMVYGGLQYVLAAGNVAKVEDAKDMITQALWGLGLILVSYLLLRTINPDLVSLTNPTLNPPAIKGSLENLLPKSVDEFMQSLPSIGEKCDRTGDVSGGLLVCVDGKWVQSISTGP